MRWLRIIAVAFFLLAAATWWLFTRPITIASDGFVFISPSTTVVHAVDSVNAHCELTSPWLVKITARIVARVTSRTVQAGWYKFNPTHTQLDVLRALFSGDKRPTVRVTIPEGSTYRTIASILARDVQCDSAAFVRWCESDSICTVYGASEASMEGYLKPDTYEFFWRTDPSRIGDRMAQAFQTMWRNECEGRLKQTGYTRHEIVTLASIVQAETGANAEMPRIAGVYLNRLSLGMRLEADPTVQYGLGIKRRLLYSDLNKPHAYNTYAHTGLPPGPINNPGLSALLASLEPESHNYIFFVARGDESGLHNFARTGAEHALNVKRYRATR
ncbi:MAG: endolytic transglycosylase MltG [bacterium]|nr:endolytic transglycosylase MltG [bacterium]